MIKDYLEKVYIRKNRDVALWIVVGFLSGWFLPIGIKYIVIALVIVLAVFAYTPEKKRA